MFRITCGVVWYFLALGIAMGQYYTDSPTVATTDANDNSTKPLTPGTLSENNLPESSANTRFGELGRNIININRALNSMKPATNMGLPAEPVTGVEKNEIVNTATAMIEADQHNQDIKLDTNSNIGMTNTALNINNPSSAIESTNTAQQTSTVGVSSITGTGSSPTSTTLSDTTIDTTFKADSSTTAVQNDNATSPTANSVTSFSSSTGGSTSDADTSTASGFTTADASSGSSQPTASAGKPTSTITTTLIEASTSETSTSTNGQPSTSTDGPSSTSTDGQLFTSTNGSVSTSANGLSSASTNGTVSTSIGGPSLYSSPVSSTSVTSSASSSVASSVSSSLSSPQSPPTNASLVQSPAASSSSAEGSPGVSMTSVTAGMSTNSSETTTENSTGSSVSGGMSSSTDAPVMSISGGVVPKMACAFIPCPNKCVLGYELDKNGCQTCKCKVHICQSGRIYTGLTARFCGRGTSFCPGALICEQAELGSKGVCCPSPLLVDCPPPRPGSRLLCLVQQRNQCRSDTECGAGRSCCPGTCGNTCRRLSRAGRRSRVLSINGL